MARESDVRFHADIDEVDVPAPIALLCITTLARA
jgi:hypothetical protein